MKCIELKVTIEVPDDYECDYPFDTIVDVNYGDYTEDDLKLLMQYLNPANRVSEVESVEITDADDITQEEADKIIEQLLKEREK